jgi:hypothetical protein
MSVDERSRHQLHRKLEQVLGSEEAGTLMAHLPPGGVSELATRQDLREVEHKLLAEIHRTARNLTLSLATIIGVLNGIVFTALKLG